MYVYETFIKCVDGSEGAEAPDTQTRTLTPYRTSDRDDALPPTLTSITGSTEYKSILESKLNLQTDACFYTIAYLCSCTLRDSTPARPVVALPPGTLV